ncbi:MAG: hypothetical protein PWQ54_2228, partial [Bacteroidales bacterium]|nr:hypothetical protein [Bacteroidales bacterium]
KQKIQNWIDGGGVQQIMQIYQLLIVSFKKVFRKAEQMLLLLLIF